LPSARFSPGVARGRPAGAAPRALAVLACAGLAGCAGWKPVRATAAWTLFAKDGAAIDVEHFDAALEPAFSAVEAHLGPFRGPVRIHAWDEEADPAWGGSGGAARARDPADESLGGARVRAFHVRGGSTWFQSSGVFLGTADAGTAVHELVHARLAELDEPVPLWFEEGLASLLGDGALVEGAWTVDGLACWPLCELREGRLGDTELERLLAIEASDDYDARENLLVHFVGWAIVFDLRREDPGGSWRRWLASFRQGARLRGELAEVRRRLDRTLAWQTHLEWLNRLDLPDPAARFATAKGIWKLHSRSAVDRLLDRLELEEHPEVRFALALNCLLATGEMRLGQERWWRLRRLAFPILREPELADAREREAAEELYGALRDWSPASRAALQVAIEVLARFWEE
jgi:hypothetical protein